MMPLCVALWRSERVTLSLRRFTGHLCKGGLCFGACTVWRLIITIGVVMKKTVVVCSSKFETQARKTVSLAFALCENRIKASKGNMTPELKAMSAAMLALEKSIDTFIAAERLSK
jgi:hypothetical protein